MAVAYATAEQYRARSAASSTVNDDLLEAQLEAASRIVDIELRVTEGHFAPTTATHIFSSSGGRTLYLRDDDGLGYGLRSVVAGGIRPDYALTGRFDQEAWDLDDPWIWPVPRNNSERPIQAIELRRVGSSPISIWPWQDGAVQIEGEWGWAATPEPITELTVHIARDLRDSLRGGAAARVEQLDVDIPYQSDTWRLWATVKNRYGRMPVMYANVRR